MPSLGPKQLVLRKWMRSRRVVRFERPFETGWIHGLVAGVGEDLLLLMPIDEGVRVNGFSACRLRDIRRLREDPNGVFVSEVLRRRKDPLPRKPRLDLGSFASLVRGAARRFPLVTIHRERACPGECNIGNVRAVEERRVTLHEIDASGVWWDEPTSFDVRQITRVDFGGGYEDALQLVGGPPPAG